MGLVLGVLEADGVVDRVGLAAGLCLLLDLHGVGRRAQVDHVDLVRHERLRQGAVRVELLDLDVHVQLVGEPVEVHLGARLAYLAVLGVEAVDELLGPERAVLLVGAVPPELDFLGDGEDEAGGGGHGGEQGGGAAGHLD